MGLDNIRLYCIKNRSKKKKTGLMALALQNSFAALHHGGYNAN